jgi:hypothetical protein
MGRHPRPPAPRLPRHRRLARPPLRQPRAQHRRIQDAPECAARRDHPCQRSGRRAGHRVRAADARQPRRRARCRDRYRHRDPGPHGARVRHPARARRRPRGGGCLRGRARHPRGRRPAAARDAFGHRHRCLRSGRLHDGQRRRSEHSGPPPVTARLPFPEAWRVVLVMDPCAGRGHGREKSRPFDACRRSRRNAAAHLCHMALMQILPALRRPISSPSRGASASCSGCVGDHFAAGSGRRFTSPQVAEALAFAESVGLPGVGQSSWGPTGFVLLPTIGPCAQWVADAQRRFGGPLRCAFVWWRPATMATVVSFTTTPASDRTRRPPARCPAETLSAMRKP